MSAMVGVCLYLYKVNWALLLVWLEYVGGARVRANVVLRATKTYAGSGQPSSMTLQSRSLKKIYDVVNRSAARTRQHTLYQGGPEIQIEKVRLERNTFCHFQPYYGALMLFP